MKGARLKAITYPDRDLVTTLNGVITFAFMRRERVLVQSGKDVGWFHLDGVPYYAAARFRLGAKGWALEGDEYAVRTLAGLDRPTGGHADQPAPEPVQKAVLALLERAFLAWIADRTDLAAEVELCDANHALFHAQDEIASLERQLERARAALPRLEAARESAKAAAKAARAARRKAVKASAAVRA